MEKTENFSEAPEKNQGLTPWTEVGISTTLAHTLIKQNFFTPREIQKKILPHAFKKASFEAISPTGSGKTLAYLLPLIFHWDRHRSRSLVLVPTQELAIQCFQMLQAIQPGHAQSTYVLHGGVKNFSNEKKWHSNWRTLIVAPGKLLEWLRKDPTLLKSIDIWIWDEYDKLLSLGFAEQIGDIKRYIPQKACLWCFSATEHINKKHRDLKVPHLKIQVIGPADTSNEKFYLFHHGKKKSEVLVEILRSLTSQTIVFTGNREKATHLKGLLKIKGISCDALHGELTRKNRQTILEQFQQGSFLILIATDLASRGLDTLEVENIVNESPPTSLKTYIHRKGRSGRKGQIRTLYTFFDAQKDYLAFDKLYKELKMEFVAGFDALDKWLPKARAKHKERTKLLSPSVLE